MEGSIKHGKMEIEKNIPIPKVKTNRRWPFVEMEIGDSVLIKIDEYSRSKHQIIATTARSAGRTREPRMEFTTRKQDDHSVRVWRIK